MKMKMPLMLSRTRTLEHKIDEFFDKVVFAGLLFRKSLNLYLQQGICDEYRTAMHEVEVLESQGDSLRREIEASLYRDTLIPDMRGDVLSLLEDADKLINRYEATLFKFDIEQPEFPAEYMQVLHQLLDTVCESVEQVIHACRAFFRDIAAVRDYTSKVQWRESEADKLSTQFLRRIFASSELDLAQKMHLRYFVERIDEIANVAEDLSDSLAIYAIKRRI